MNKNNTHLIEYSFYLLGHFDFTSNNPTNYHKIKELFSTHFKEAKSVPLELGKKIDPSQMGEKHFNFVFADGMIKFFYLSTNRDDVFDEIGFKEYVKSVTKILEDNFENLRFYQFCHFAEFIITGIKKEMIDNGLNGTLMNKSFFDNDDSYLNLDWSSSLSFKHKVNKKDDAGQYEVLDVVQNAFSSTLLENNERVLDISFKTTTNSQRKDARFSIKDVTPWLATIDKANAKDATNFIRKVFNVENGKVNR